MSSPVETISLGCRLNAYETERMAALAKSHSSGPAVVVNTCAVTNEAVRQSRQAIRKARKDHPDAEIIVSGCAVQLDAEGFAQMEEVSRVIGNGDKLSPVAWVKSDAVSNVFDKDALPQGPAPLAAPQARAHLEVQNGCDHRCTFCIIPYGRGKARSKPPTAVAREAMDLVERGAKEIVLTGVDLTSYGPDLGEEMTLADPIEALLEALPQNIRIRLSSIDGAEVDDRLFALITQDERIMPHLHLSLQSGDTMILKRMKRRHQREDAVALCQRLRVARPDIAFGADLIAGFPTETEEMFENSVRLIADCDLSYVHVFPFSPRKGTPAALMPQHPRDLIKDRAARLRAAADAALQTHLSRRVGTTGTILIEQTIDGVSLGKLPDFTEVRVPGDYPMGAFVDVTLTEKYDRTLMANPIIPLETADHG